MTIIAIVTAAPDNKDAGYIERLREELARKCLELEAKAKDREDVAAFNIKLRQALELEVRQQQRQLAEQGVEIEGLRAEAERVELLERQLAAQDQLILEMRAALHLAKLPTESRSNVIDLVQAAA